MLTKKDFIEFADFLVEEELKIIPRYNEIKTDIELILNDDNETLSNKQNKIYRILLEKMNKYHRVLTSEIMLVLDKNSLRFNKYQFKNYIISHVEKKELNNANKEHTIQLNI